MKKKLFSSILALVLAMSCVLTACQGPTQAGTENPGTQDSQGSETPEKTLADYYKEGTTLRMATGYNKANTGISFDAETAGEGITLANGQTYKTGELKPTWQTLQTILNVKFEDKFTGAGSASKEFAVWKEKLAEVDMVAGSVSDLQEAGAAGSLVNIAEYLDLMPNFKAYLEANPIVRLSITGDTKTGAIYFSPYFDGVNDIERMPLMRTDWVVELLNGEGDFVAKDGSANLKAAVYEPYMPTSGTVEVDVVKADGTGTEKVTKNYDKAGNIVAKMNEALAAGTVTGEQAVNMLRDYIDAAYDNYYGTNRADLFIGQNAAWDADELVALLRCVVANAKTLNGTDTVQGIFSRQDNSAKRKIDMVRFAGVLFGVRGLESRQDYLYVGTDGKLHDARQEGDAYVAMERMNAMAQEGLIASSYINNEKVDTKTMLKNDAGFMHYDYNQTQTLYNGQDGIFDEGEKYMAVIIPVARWNDGTEKYMRFTESWRSVKTDGWAISKAGVATDESKLYAALALIDYAYSEKGQILMSYGPDEFIKTNADGSYVTFMFNGKAMPVISDATYDELWEKAGGNYTNYARYYLGSTLSFVKSQAFEYQCTHDVGKEGAAKLSVAIAHGIIKHPELALTENAWYTSMPTTLPTTDQQNATIAEFVNLGSKGKFSSSNDDSTNLYISIITGGYAAAETTGKDALVKTVSEEWGGATYLSLKQNAWEKLQAYYNELSK